MVYSKSAGTVALGVLLLAIGIYALWRGVRLWRRPKTLRPGSMMYRQFLSAWQSRIGARRSRTQDLNDKRIRYFAVRVIAGGCIFGVVGLVLILAP